MCKFTDVVPTEEKYEISHGDTVMFGHGIASHIGPGMVTKIDEHNFEANGTFTNLTIITKGTFSGTWSVSLNSSDGKTWSFSAEIAGQNKDGSKTFDFPISASQLKCKESGKGKDTTITYTGKDSNDKEQSVVQTRAGTKSKVYFKHVVAGELSLDLYFYKIKDADNLMAENLTFGNLREYTINFENQSKRIDNWDIEVKVWNGDTNEWQSSNHPTYSNLYLDNAYNFSLDGKGATKSLTVEANLPAIRANKRNRAGYGQLMFIISGFEKDGEGVFRQGFCTIAPTINAKAWKPAHRSDSGFDAIFKVDKSGGGTIYLRS